MAHTTTKIFEHLEQQQEYTIIRHKISSDPFSKLRKSLLKIISSILEIDSGHNEIARGLRASLSDWLTSPIAFDTRMLGEVMILGSVDEVYKRWGHDIGGAYEVAVESARKLSEMENPIRVYIKDFVLKSISDNKKVKIFCHKYSKQNFESMLAPISQELPESEFFLHNSRAYAKTDFFDVLIKVGPLRPRGWGATPDSIVTVPRYNSLAQFVWSGSRDEAGFGFDPVLEEAIIDRLAAVPDTSTSISSGYGLKWSRQDIIIGDFNSSGGDTSEDEDEFEIFKSMEGDRYSAKKYLPAVLVQIEEPNGILYVQQSQVLSYGVDTDGFSTYAKRVPGDTLVEGMFIIVPNIDDIDLGARKARAGALSPIWKKKLRESLEEGFDKLLKGLRNGGLDLKSGLEGRIKDWCKESTTVIPAPKRRDHFRILLKSLGLFGATTESEQLEWIRRAWNEVRRSRGEAITDGVVGQKIRDEKIEHLLKDIEPSVKEMCKDQNSFQALIPDDDEIDGSFHFHKIISIESGYHAPSEAIGVITELKELFQWRV